MILYIGCSKNVARRLRGHDQIARLRAYLQRYEGVGYVEVYEGEPTIVEPALVAAFGLPAWNERTVLPREAPLSLVYTGCPFVNLHRPIRGGYVIGVRT